jgi:DNA-directed RNA polymerase specialized sigma24 family protein
MALYIIVEYSNTDFYAAHVKGGLTVHNSKYWRKQVLKHWQQLDRLAQKKFSNTEMANEAVLYAVAQLEKDDWKRARAFRGRSSFSTFLMAVASRLFQDFFRKKIGRLRPPVWLKAQGGLWVRVFTLLCQERQSIDETVEALCDATVEDQPLCRFEVEEAVAVILARITTCGQYIGEPISSDPEDLNHHEGLSPQLHHLDPEAFLAVDQRVSLMEAVGKLLMGDGDHLSNHDSTTQTAIHCLGTQLKLSAEDRLFLKTIYLEGLSVSRAGDCLGINANQAHGKHRRLMTKIHKAIETVGLENELKSLLCTGGDGSS